MSNVEEFRSISVPSSKFIEIRNFINDKSNESLVLIEYEGKRMISIPLKRQSTDNASNIVCNWMNDIIEIIEKGEKNFSKPDMVMSEIKAYCKSVKTTVTSE